MERADISYKTKRGEVFFDPDKVNEATIVEKVNQIGFKAKVVEK